MPASFWRSTVRIPFTWWKLSGEFPVKNFCEAINIFVRLGFNLSSRLHDHISENFSRIRDVENFICKKHIRTHNVQRSLKVDSRITPLVKRETICFCRRELSSRRRDAYKIIPSSFLRRLFKTFFAALRSCRFFPPRTSRWRRGDGVSRRRRRRRHRRRSRCSLPFVIHTFRRLPTNRPSRYTTLSLIHKHACYSKHMSLSLFHTYEHVSLSVIVSLSYSVSHIKTHSFSASLIHTK